MTAFLWAIIAMVAVEAVLKLACIVFDLNPERGRGTMALEIIIGVGLIVWASVLLAS